MRLSWHVSELRGWSWGLQFLKLGLHAWWYWGSNVLVHFACTYNTRWPFTFQHSYFLVWEFSLGRIDPLKLALAENRSLPPHEFNYYTMKWYIWHEMGSILHASRSSRLLKAHGSNCGGGEIGQSWVKPSSNTNTMGHLKRKCNSQLHSKTAWQYRRGAINQNRLM